MNVVYACESIAANEKHSNQTAIIAVADGKAIVNFSLRLFPYYCHFSNRPYNDGLLITAQILSIIAVLLSVSD